MKGFAQLHFVLNEGEGRLQFFPAVSKMVGQGNGQMAANKPNHVECDRDHLTAHMKINLSMLPFVQLNKVRKLCRCLLEVGKTIDDRVQQKPRKKFNFASDGLGNE